MSLFKRGVFTSHAGDLLDWKIECEALTDDDWDCLAWLIAARCRFSAVYDVPRGGTALANSLRPYISKDESLPALICDDVLTTGVSMEELRSLLGESVIGVVVFDRSRGKCPDWITPLFKLT